MTQLQELTEYKLVKEIVDKHGSARENLLPVLHAIQNTFGYIPHETQQIVADLMGIHPVEVFSVISFYHFLSEKPKGEVIIRLCKSASCLLAGKNEIKTEIEKILGINAGESTNDGKFFFEEINCFGLCDAGPALCINDKIYTQVKKEDVKKILSEYAENKI